MAITLKQARIGVDFTQAKMAEELGVGVNTYRKWENDPSLMPIKIARRFCELVKLSEENIFFGTQVELK